MDAMSKPGETVGSSSEPWRVRFGGQVYRVKDRASLERLADTGKVPANAEVQVPGSGAWQPLSAVMATSGQAPSGGDPWSAWDSLDDDDLPPAPASADDDALPPTKPAPATRTALLPAPRQPGQPPADDLPEVHPMPEEPVPAMTLSVSHHDDETEEDDEELATHDSEGPIALGEASASEPAHVPSRVRPPADPTPRAAPPVGQASGQRRQGNVIYFPGPRPGRRDTEGATALDPARDPEPLPFPDSSPRLPVDPTAALAAGSGRGGRGRRAADNRPRTNWWRVGGVAFVGALILGAVRFYVAMNTGIDYGPTPRQPAAPPGAEIYLEDDPGTASATADAAVDDDPVSTAALRDPYKDMEVDLRSRMMQGLQPVESADQLETALFMELTNVGLSQAKVGVNVLATAGDTDIPEVVEVRVQVRDNGSGLDRQIGAASLVVGKYVQHLELTVPLFELGFEGITEGKVRKRRIDADQARQLFLARLRLRDFLAGLRH